jgi:hypothetical protein
MNVYKKDNLDQISKYAQKCESGIVADKFTNIFIKAEQQKVKKEIKQKLEFKMNVIDKPDPHGQIISCDDEASNQMIDVATMAKRYYVFDEIEEKKRYDIFRIENR